MRFLRHSMVGVFLASLTLGLLIYAGQLVTGAVQQRMNAETAPPAPRERVFAVNVIEAAAETLSPRLEAFGEVQSRRTLELRAATGGRVIELADAFEDGGSVRAGDVLVRIDPADAQSALDRADSDLLDAEAEGRDAARGLVLAQDELAAAIEQEDLRDRAFRRQLDLQARGVATAAVVEVAELAAAAARQAVLSRRQAVAQAEARIDQAATALARARIARDGAERELAETTLTAAFDGTLSEVNLVEGRLVSVNEKLAVLIDPLALEVAFRVSTAQYARLLGPDGRVLKAPVVVSLDASGANLTARAEVSRDSAGSGAGQSGRLIFAGMASAPGFKPGDFVEVSVEEPALERVVRLPASALDAAGRVLVLGTDDRLESLSVDLLRRQGDDVLVRGVGLEGREVVTGLTPLIGAGIKVRPLRQGGVAGNGPEMLELSEERRARLVAFVEANQRMPAEVKARMLTQLTEPRVPAGLVERIESRMGG